MSAARTGRGPRKRSDYRKDLKPCLGRPCKSHYAMTVESLKKDETHFFYLVIEREKKPDLINAIEVSAGDLRGYSVTHKECDDQWSQDGSMVEYHIEISGPEDYGCSKAIQLFGRIMNEIESVPLKKRAENLQIELAKSNRLLSDILELQTSVDNHEWRQALSKCILTALDMRNITAEQVAKDADISKTTLYSAMDGENCTTETMFSLMRVLGIAINFTFVDQQSWEKSRQELKL